VTSYLNFTLVVKPTYRVRKTSRNSKAATLKHKFLSKVENG